jgi:hypothetical protein
MRVTTSPIQTDESGRTGPFAALKNIAAGPG